MHLQQIALAALVAFSSVDARPLRRDRISDDDDSFAIERRDPNFACLWTTDATTGARGFWCPSPCRLNDKISRRAEEDLQPKHWTCPPTVFQQGVNRKDELCHWKRSGRLACPQNCGWEQDGNGSFAWQCRQANLLKLQTADVREQMHLGWAKGPLDNVEIKVRSAYLCPAGELACPLKSGIDVGATLVPSGSYECVNAFDSFENCGGCGTIPGSGMNCGLVKHAHAGCVAGQCTILSCKAGYGLSSDGNECLHLPSTSL